MAVAMGCLGEQRARLHYDWSVVLRRYSELMMICRRDVNAGDPALSPLKSHPPLPPLAQIFAAWPSHTIDAQTSIQPCGNASSLHQHLQLEMVRIYRRELPPAELIQKTFQQLQNLGNASLHELQNLPNPSWSATEAALLPESLGWLLKHGFAAVDPS